MSALAMAMHVGYGLCAVGVGLAHAWRAFAAHDRIRVGAMLAGMATMAVGAGHIVNVAFTLWLRWFT